MYVPEMGLESLFGFHSCLLSFACVHACLDFCVRETVQPARMDTVTVVVTARMAKRKVEEGGRCRFQDWDVHYCVVRGPWVNEVYSELLT